MRAEEKSGRASGGGRRGGRNVLVLDNAHGCFKHVFFFVFLWASDECPAQMEFDFARCWSRLTHQRRTADTSIIFRVSMCLYKKYLTFWQDLAVVPLLVAIPLLAGGGGGLVAALTSAATKAAIALGLIAFIGKNCPASKRGQLYLLPGCH